MAWCGQARWCVARFGEARRGVVWYGLVARYGDVMLGEV